MKTKNNKKMKSDGVTVRLVWGNPANIETVYSNNLFITHAGNEFYLVFGEMPPITELDVSNLPDHLEIKPVAKIAITQENMVKFANAISENLTKFNERTKKPKE